MRQALGLTKLRWTVWQQDGVKPHQAKMVMKWLDTIFQDRMLAIKCLRGDTPTLRSPLFFIFMMDFCTITSGILPNSTPNCPLQCSHVSRERLVHFLFHVPPKKEITWVGIRCVGGQGVPPQALDGMHPVLVSSHSITILAWCAFASAWCHTVHLSLASPGSASWQARPCPPTAAFSWTGWPSPSHLLTGIRTHNVDLCLDFLLRFHEYLSQKCS